MSFGDDTLDPQNLEDDRRQQELEKLRAALAVAERERKELLALHKPPSDVITMGRSQLIEELTHLRWQRDQLQRRNTELLERARQAEGACSCSCDEQDECCPQHGIALTEMAAKRNAWCEKAMQLQERAEAAEAEVERLREQSRRAAQPTGRGIPCPSCGFPADYNHECERCSRMHSAAEG